MVAMHAFLTQLPCLSLYTPWTGTAQMTTVRLRSVLITIEPSVGGSKKIGPATYEREAKEESRNLGNKPSDGTGPIRSYSYCAFPPPALPRVCPALRGNKQRYTLCGVSFQPLYKCTVATHLDPLKTCRRPRRPGPHQ